MAKANQKDLLESDSNIPEEIKWIEKTTNLLDSKFKIPGTSITFGIDPIIGLIPGFGEIVSYSISAGLVLSMVRNGASQKVAVKMLKNLAVDALVGLVPFLGDIFDVFYKANRRNYQLLREHQIEGKHEGTAWGLIIGVTLAILVMFALLVFGLVKVWSWFFGLF